MKINDNAESPKDLSGNVWTFFDDDATITITFFASPRAYFAG